MTDICVIAARRTPIGRFLGALQDLSPVDLACAAGRAVLRDLDPQAVDLVVLGNVLAAGHGMNLARQVGVGLGLPTHVPAYTVNMMCASGLQAVLLAAQAITAGQAQAVLCGGTESMSQAAYLLPRVRAGLKLGDGAVVDSLLRDGLVDTFDRRHMGLTAEALAQRYGISRAEQDQFAALSQQRCGAAQAAGEFTAEIAPLEALAADEHPRPQTTAEKLGTLKPAFDPAGSVTPGNASGLNDGAALLLLASAERARELRWPVLARFEAGTVVGCEPAWMGLGPVHATAKLLGQLGRSLADYDAIELNEAFAAQTLACLREWHVPPERVNACGGAIAIGHPIGASGARLATHLVHRLAAGKAQRTLATLCVGGGMGIAASFVRA